MQACECNNTQYSPGFTRARSTAKTRTLHRMVGLVFSPGSYQQVRSAGFCIYRGDSGRDRPKGTRNIVPGPHREWKEALWYVDVLPNKGGKRGKMCGEAQVEETGHLKFTRAGVQGFLGGCLTLVQCCREQTESKLSWCGQTLSRHYSAFLREQKVTFRREKEVLFSFTEFSPGRDELLTGLTAGGKSNNSLT